MEPDGYYIGESFEDALFNADSQTREKAAVWKVLRTPLFFDLTAGSWKWVAVGIPFELIDRRASGRHRSAGGAEAFNRASPSNDDGPVYRAFEAKASLITRRGEGKSLKAGKSAQTAKQVNRLAELGPHETFLLEIYLAEAGLAERGPELPARITDQVGHRLRTTLAGSSAGYASCVVEQIRDYDEDNTGMGRPFAVHKRAARQSLRAPFSNIAAAVDAFYVEQQASPLQDAVSCNSCHELIIVKRWGPYECARCNRSLC